MKVIVDADACPRQVLEIIRRLQAAHGYELRTVSSFSHRHEDPGHIYVGDDPQAADLAVANLAAAGDIVITQDWGLAAMVLGKGAHALAPDGRVFRPETISFLLEERNLKARHRRGGGRTKGPAARTREDDRRFAEAFAHLIGFDKS
ncbi:MAG: YaiI/YqxD family protein [Bacteroidota bacterium]